MSSVQQFWSGVPITISVGITDSPGNAHSLNSVSATYGFPPADGPASVIALVETSTGGIFGNVSTSGRAAREHARDRAPDLTQRATYKPLAALGRNSHRCRSRDGSSVYPGRERAACGGYSSGANGQVLPANATIGDAVVLFLTTSPDSGIDGASAGFGTLNIEPGD